MIHSFDSQLQVALRALEEVVAPALAGAEKHVVEQLMLAVVTIGFVKTRLPEARRFYRMELRTCLEMAQAAGEIAGTSAELAQAIAAGNSALTDPEADDVEFEAASRRLRDLVTALSAAKAGQPEQIRLDAVIMEKSSALLGQYRLWCAPFGFELQPEKLPKPAW
jgi:hypothetical protein